MAEKALPAMEYRYLGNSGLKVSVIAYGDVRAQDTEEDQKRTNEIVQKCFELGINYFDTAENYGVGTHERVLGKALKASGKQRSEFVVSTKIFQADLFCLDPNKCGLSRKHLIEGLKNSLERLQLDYVDVVYCHRPDPTTPMEEVVLTIKDIFEKNLAFYWATSEWSAPEIMHAYWLCEKHGVQKPIAEQVHYNMLHRQRFEVEYGYIFDKYKMGATIWGTLSGGLLTGKLLDENFDRTGTRYDMPRLNKLYKIDTALSPENIENTKKMFAGLGEIAKELGITTAELAIAWVLKSGNVTSAVLGLTKVSHVESALNAVQAYSKLTKEHEEKLDKVLGTCPDFGIDWKNFAEKPARRLKFYS